MHIVCFSPQIYAWHHTPKKLRFFFFVICIRADHSLLKLLSLRPLIHLTRVTNADLIAQINTPLEMLSCKQYSMYVQLNFMIKMFQLKKIFFFFAITPHLF